MNVSQAVKQYVTQMIKDSGAGMKVLVMDKETIATVSMVYSQSEILQKEVYLFELLTNRGRESMRHLNAICFLRPTQDNIELLSDELKAPKYNSYFVYFSNKLDRSGIKQLAESDLQESVREIKEFYGDYLAVGPHLFSLNQPVCCDPGMIWRREVFLRVSDGLTSVLLALRKKPLIRYSSASNTCKRLAEELHRGIARERELFDFTHDVAPILLILDRRDDPVTPLLNQWTYQAMVHELLGIKNHRVDLSMVPGLKADMKEVVLAPEHDEFFRENMYLNFGEIGANIKSLVETYQSRSKSQAKLESIADMKAFIENYPEFKKLSGTVSKHVAVVGELSRVVADHKVMVVSECEQDIVTASDRNVFKTLEGVLSEPQVRLEDSLRLGLLYTLRYEGSTKGDLQRVEQLLLSRGHSDSDKRMLRAMLEHSGRAKRGSDLFEAQAGALSKTRKFFKGLKGVENVYTRHKPLLADMLDQLMREKLSETDFPYCGEFRLADRTRPQDVIVFMVGGATYAEALVVANTNKSNPGVRIVLGGSTIHNSKSFLEEVQSSTHTFSRGGRTLA